MIKKEELPNFITELMYKWLCDYQSGSFEEITTLGLFNWRKKIDKNNRTVLDPQIQKEVIIKQLNFSRAYYFHESTPTELHVYVVSGFFKAGSRNSTAYKLEGGKFKAFTIAGTRTLIS